MLQLVCICINAESEERFCKPLQPVPRLEHCGFPAYDDIVYSNILFEERSLMLPLVCVDDNAAHASPDQVPAFQDIRIMSLCTRRLISCHDIDACSHASVPGLQAESRPPSALHDWGCVCADLGIRTINVASAALKLDWSLTATPRMAGGAALQDIYTEHAMHGSMHACMHACTRLPDVNRQAHDSAHAHDLCQALAAGLFDRLTMQQRQEGSSLLAQHLLPAQEKLQQPSALLYDRPALLPLLLGKDTTRAADEQPEQLPHAVEMHLRERLAALEQKQQQQGAQQGTGEKQQREEPDAGRMPAPDVHTSAEGGTRSAAPSEPAVVQHAVQQHHQPSPLQPAARASGVFARPGRNQRHSTAGKQVLAGTQPAKERVGSYASTPPVSVHFDSMMQ